MSILLSIAWGVFAFIVDAWAIHLVWGWHGVPVGLPAITMWRAAGLSALWGVFALRLSAQEIKLMLDFAKTDAGKAESKRVDLWRRGTWLALVLSIVGIAWIAHRLAP